MLGAAPGKHHDRELLAGDDEIEPRDLLDELSAEAIAPLTVVQAQAALLERGCHGLGRIAENVELDCRGLRRRALEDRADELRAEPVEQGHDVGRDEAQLRDPQIVSLRLEHSLPLHEALVNLRIARQRSFAGAHTEALGSFPLGLCEVLDAVLGHEPRRLIGQLLAQVGRGPRRRSTTAAHSRYSKPKGSLGGRVPEPGSNVSDGATKNPPSRSGTWSMSNFSKM